MPIREYRSCPLAFPLLADAVAKVENRTTLKVSRKPMFKAEIVLETGRKVSSPAGSRGNHRFIDPALEASKNVSKNCFAFGNFVFSGGIGL